MRSRIKAEVEDYDRVDTIRKIATAWKAITEEELEKWQEASQKDKERWENEVAQLAIDK